MKITDIVDFNPKRPLKKTGSAPFVDMAALPTGARDIEEIGSRQVSGSGAKFKDGDVLFARITPCLENGKTAQVSGLGEGICAHGSTEFIVMSAKDPENDKEFVYYIARLPEFRAYAQSRMEGTSGRQRVSWQALADFEYSFPDKIDRKRIGEILRTLDDKIALNRQTNQTLEAMAQALFKSWFVDFEPVRTKIAALETGEDPTLAAMRTISGKTDDELTTLQANDPDAYNQLETTASLFPDALVESKLGFVPEGWEVGTLKDLSKLNSSSWGTSNLPETVHYVDLASVKDGVISEIQVFNRESAPSRARRRLKAGDTIVGTVRPGNRSFAYINKYETELTGSTGFAVLTPKQLHISEFIYLVATADEVIEKFAHLADGGAYPAIRPEVVIQTDCVLSDEKLLYHFHRVVAPFFELRAKNDCENRTLATLRDTLLPKLLSGEINLLISES